MAGYIHVQRAVTVDCRFSSVRPNVFPHTSGRGVAVSRRPRRSPKDPTHSLFNPDRFFTTSLRPHFYPECW